MTYPTKGYTVPERVRADPDLSRTANQLVATWCLLAAGLAVAPSVALLPTLQDILPSYVSMLIVAVPLALAWRWWSRRRCRFRCG